MEQATLNLEGIADPEDKLAKLKALYRTEAKELCQLAKLDLTKISYNELKVTFRGSKIQTRPCKDA